MAGNGNDPAVDDEWRLSLSGTERSKASAIRSMDSASARKPLVACYGSRRPWSVRLILLTFWPFCSLSVLRLFDLSRHRRAVTAIKMAQNDVSIHGTGHYGLQVTNVTMPGMISVGLAWEARHAARFSRRGCPRRPV